MTKRKGAELADASSAAKAAPKAARNGAGGTELDRARRFVHFLTAAVTPFHAVSLGASMLETAGFVRLEEDSPWTGVLKPGGKYYYTRCDSTLVAFAVGGGYKPGGAFKVVGAHTDSPALKAKPLTKHGSGAAESLTQVSVATYGGGLWHTWFDRDLGIGGMVLTRGADGAVSKRLVAVHEPVLRVPSLCIHLQTAEERASFAPNKESHLAPVLCVAARRQLEGAAPDAGAYAAAQEPELMRLLAERMGVGLEAIVSFDLTLFDTQPPAIGGTHSEFVLGGRLDNLASSFVALEALIDSADEVCTRAAESDVACIALFDHEEVGSSSQQGAGGPVMKEMLTRVSDALGAPTGSEPHAIGLRKSFLLSVDNAHAVHPNYRTKHEGSHRPLMGGGCVIKSNSNLRYATDSVTSYIVRELGRRAGTPVQEFVVKNDCPCGSTIGPILSSALGVRACDIGMPQLSMHSVREMMGVDDLTHCYALMAEFFKNFGAVDKAIASCAPCAER